MSSPLPVDVTSLVSLVTGSVGKILAEVTALSQTHQHTPGAHTAIRHRIAELKAAVDRVARDAGCDHDDDE